MNSLGPLLEQFSLPEISSVLKRTVFTALGLGVVAVVATLFVSQPLFGLGVCIGLGLGLLNIRMVTNQTARVTQLQPAKPVRALASMTLARLGITTVCVIVLFIASRWLGFGTAAGLCLFYLLFVGNIIAMMVRHKVST
ncbi:MAG TPA: ATP synthase subunit I [Acidimicrobiales bacterium]|nr:ATP synthase subunit I [Acidimicrobiales bacterium]